MVTLAEDLYLLATKGSTGRLLIDATRLDLGLAGALLLDLALHEHVDLADSHVVVSSGPPTGEALLDAALADIAGETRTHGPEHWVRHLARGAHRAVQDHLVDIGILRRDADTVLHVLPVHRAHETDGRLHHELQDHLNQAVLLDRPPSPETAALASLVLAVGLERHLFPRADRRQIHQRLTEIADGRWVAPVVAGEVTVLDVALGIGPPSAPPWD